MLVVGVRESSKLKDFITRIFEYEGRTFVSSLLENQIQVEGEPILTQKTRNIAKDRKNINFLTTFGKNTPTTQI